MNAYNRVLFEGVLALFNEGRGVTKVDYTRADRAPLLVIMGGEDHVVPPAIGKALVKKYRRTESSAVVEYKEFPGRTHRMVGQGGWEEIADFALDWAATSGSRHVRRWWPTPGTRADGASPHCRCAPAG
ncbi:hypothetical protein [Promicromonospora sp. NPDC090134]|uniref:hypothetical protein n=1 Tax=Promicromonospora sp. NPDC090134 TaxID=3364408 RepID=UPI0038110736